jgi:hypothetical protein
MGLGLTYYNWKILDYHSANFNNNLDCLFFPTRVTKFRSKAQLDSSKFPELWTPNEIGIAQLNELEKIVERVVVNRIRIAPNPHCLHSPRRQ